VVDDWSVGWFGWFAFGFRPVSVWVVIVVSIFLDKKTAMLVPKLGELACQLLL
jgi:hypothetical protein